MYIEYRSYFLFNRFLPNSCILTRENVRFFAIFLFTYLYFLLITTYITKKQLKPYRKVTVFNHSPSLHTSPLK
ncbi:unknown [Parabacteroides johnsonii CAG:246]|nr:unknown [Parabacteroides johnsonii CAG:246]